MSFKAGLRTYLLTNASISSAIGTKIYSFPAPQDASMPYLMLSRISQTIVNLSSETLDIYNESWQIDIYASTDESAETIQELVIGQLNMADRVNMGSYFVYTCSLSTSNDGGDLSMDGGEDVDIRKTIDFEILRERNINTP